MRKQEPVSQQRATSIDLDLHSTKLPQTAIKTEEVIKMLNDTEIQSSCHSLKPNTNAENIFRVRQVRDKSIAYFREHAKSNSIGQPLAGNGNFNCSALS